MKNISFSSILGYTILLFVSFYASSYFMQGQSLYTSYINEYIMTFNIEGIVIAEGFNKSSFLIELLKVFGLSIFMVMSLTVLSLLLNKSKVYKNMKSVLNDQLFGLFAEPSKKVSIVLMLIPFLIAFGSYGVYSNYKTDLEPKQKIFPVMSKIGNTFIKNSTTADKRIDRLAYKNTKTIEKALEEAEAKGLNKMTVELIDDDKNKFKVEKSVTMLKAMLFTENMTASKVYTDTTSSLYRLLIAMSISASIALFIALFKGLFKPVDILLNKFLVFFGAIQPVAILPILMILAGVDDSGKVVFIVTVLTTTLLLAIDREVKAIHKQTIIKGLTMGVSQLGTVHKVVLPQILPRFIDIIRSNLYLAWIFLLTSEMISAESGLGYRIMLFKRTTAMDNILSYVIWITVLSLLLDFALRQVNKRLFPWYNIAK
jgi:NitT/TauT family transport system permease protein